MSGIMIYTLIYVPASDLNLFGFAYLFLMFIHFWWTIVSGLKSRKVSNELTLKLNKWQELNVDEISFIEMKVLKRTIEMFKREENNEETTL
jgi:hypothetical protein